MRELTFLGSVSQLLLKMGFPGDWVPKDKMKMAFLLGGSREEGEGERGWRLASLVSDLDLLGDLEGLFISWSPAMGQAPCRQCLIVVTVQKDSSIRRLGSGGDLQGHFVQSSGCTVGETKSQVEGHPFKADQWLVLL